MMLTNCFHFLKISLGMREKTGDAVKEPKLIKKKNQDPFPTKQTLDFNL